MIIRKQVIAAWLPSVLTLCILLWVLGTAWIEEQSCVVGTLWIKKVPDPATNPVGEKRDDKIERHLMFQDDAGSCSVGATPGCDRRLHRYMNEMSARYFVVSKYRCEER